MILGDMGAEICSMKEAGIALDIVEDGLQKLGPLVGLLTVSPSPAV